MLYMIAMQSLLRNKKTSKNDGNMSIFVKEAMRESAMWHFEEVLEGLLEPSEGSFPAVRESLFSKNGLFYRYFWHVGFCMTHSIPFMRLIKV